MAVGVSDHRLPSIQGPRPPARALSDPSWILGFKKLPLARYRATEYLYHSGIIVLALPVLCGRCH